MVNQKIWHAREAVMKVASDITITGAAALDTFFSSGSVITGVMKDITFKEPTGEVDQVDLLGTDGNGFQNAEGELKPYSMAEVSGTMILPGGLVTEGFFYPAGSTVAGVTRFQPGKGTIANRRTPSVLLNLTDGTYTTNVVVDNAWVTAKEIKVTGADGHFEITGTLKCLPRDYYIDIK